MGFDYASYRGSSADVLTGRDGADRFDVDQASHSSSTRPDHITDFKRYQDDRIDLREVDGNEHLDAVRA